MQSAAEASHVDVQTRQAIDMLLARLPEGVKAREVVLFGSRARQTHGPDSDADVAIVLDGLCDRFALACELAGVACDVMLETGILVQAVPLRTEEFDHPERAANPGFVKAIHRDGIWL